jgi:hypothetical protein
VDILAFIDQGGQLRGKPELVSHRVGQDDKLNLAVIGIDEHMPLRGDKATADRRSGPCLVCLSGKVLQIEPTSA